MRTYKEFINEGNNSVDIHGLKCDNPDCDWEDMTIGLDEYDKWVGKPCPKCGQIVLTGEDYQKVKQIIQSVEILNMYSEEDLNNIVANLSPEEIDGALDMMNLLKMKKIGVDEKGKDIWSAL